MDPLEASGMRSPIFGRELHADLGADGSVTMRLDNFALSGFEKDGPTRRCTLRGRLLPRERRWVLTTTDSDCPGAKPGTEYLLKVKLYSPLILKFLVEGTGLPGGLHDFALRRGGATGPR
jgi:hypothetical protein